jgi:hypothetical protein
MSLLKVNEVQNYNGSSLTLTASTVSTSAQLNTGGNISVTGSINVSDDSTTRSNLGLGSIATQDSHNVTITGGNISNATLASSVTFPVGHVIRVEHAVYTTSTSITATTKGSGTSTGLSVTITPVSSSNKFFISYVGTFYLARHGAPWVSIEIHDGTSVVATDENYGFYINSIEDEYDNQIRYPFQAYITPSGSGPITYTVRAWKSGNAVSAQGNSRPSTLTIMEIQQ